MKDKTEINISWNKQRPLKEIMLVVNKYTKYILNSIEHNERTNKH